MKKYFICNLKNHLKRENLSDYICKLKDMDKENLILAPSLLNMKDFENVGVKLCSQDLPLKDITGEGDLKDFKDLGVKYAIIGHSERRNYLLESVPVITAKIERAIKNGIIPILCVGESDFENVEYELGLELKSVENLLDENFLVAYEPEYAIGNGVSADINLVKRNIKFIKNIVGDKPVLYGGSVNSKNLREFLDCEEIDGVLVGKASADIDELERMIQENK